MSQKIARKLRKESTAVEMKLWHYLRNRRFLKLKFRRQYPIGSYIVDFICLEKKIIIEVDGSQHIEQQAYDAIRTNYLESFGFKVLRFWNNEVNANIYEVLEVIRVTINY